MIFTVEYTNESQVGNQTLTMEIEAVNLADAWETVEAHYPHLAVETVYPKERAYI
jgi:hypothetical protein